MPSINPKTGKNYSGAAILKKRKERQKAELLAQATRDDSQKSNSLSFDDLPPPPLESSAEAVVWWNRVLLVCADQVMRDKGMTLEQKVRFLYDGAGKAGMIRDKAKEQESIKKILLHQKKSKTAHGLQDASQFGTPEISRPPG